MNFSKYRLYEVFCFGLMSRLAYLEESLVFRQLSVTTMNAGVVRPLPAAVTLGGGLFGASHMGGTT